MNKYSFITQLRQIFLTCQIHLKMTFDLSTSFLQVATQIVSLKYSLTSSK